MLYRINLMPHTDIYSLKYILILSSHPRLGLPRGLLHSDNMTCPFQAYRPNHSRYIRWTVQTMKSLIIFTNFILNHWKPLYTSSCWYSLILSMFRSLGRHSTRFAFLTLSVIFNSPILIEIFQIEKRSVNSWENRKYTPI